MTYRKQGEYKNGFWIPQVNNKEGHNQHTPKALLKPKEAKKTYTLEDVKELYQTRRKAYSAYLSAVQLHIEAQNQVLGYNARVKDDEDN